LLFFFYLQFGDVCVTSQKLEKKADFVDVS